MTGTEVGLIAALTGMAGIVGGALLGRKDRVSTKECDLIAGNQAARETEHYSNLNQGITEVKTQLHALDTKVDSWSASILGTPERGRRAGDAAVGDSS